MPTSPLDRLLSYRTRRGDPPECRKERGDVSKASSSPRNASRPFDLIVVSEIAYYLTSRKLDDLLRRVFEAAAPGSRIVFLHHLRRFADAAILPHLAQAEIITTFSHLSQRVFHERHARFDVVAFVKKRPIKRKLGFSCAPGAHLQKRA
jgi:hypothetical protein